MERVRLRFAGLDIGFVDRDLAIKQVEELAEKGTFPVYVIYGPEGCGKTAFLKQAKEVLEREFGYSVVLASPLARSLGEMLQYTPSIRDIVRDVLGLFPEPYSRIADVAINIASGVLRAFNKPRLAVLMDDIFQAVGLNNVEIYTKALLNLIEHPPKIYENIVVLVASSEGASRERIGRHSWATIKIMWNMNKEGFKQLYDALPGDKPPFEDVWRLSGGNPRVLENLYRSGWSVDAVVGDILLSKRVKDVIAGFSGSEIEILRQAIQDPDILFKRYREAKDLVKKLIEMNLVIRVWDRKPYFWIDDPPPERDPELGIGREYAWQTPLHREAVRWVLERSTREGGA